MYNKSFYFKSFLSQIPSKSKYINNVITLKAENEQINLPNVQGLIFINIPSWSAGADIWKVDKDNERWDCQGNFESFSGCKLASLFYSFHSYNLQNNDITRTVKEFKE